VRGAAGGAGRQIRAPLPLRGHLPRPAGAGGGAAAHARGCRASAALLYYFVGRVRVFAASRGVALIRRRWAAAWCDDILPHQMQKSM